MLGLGLHLYDRVCGIAWRVWHCPWRILWEDRRRNQWRPFSLFFFYLSIWIQKWTNTNAEWWTLNFIELRRLIKLFHKIKKNGIYVYWANSMVPRWILLCQFGTLYCPCHKKTHKFKNINSKYTTIVLMIIKNK